MYFLWDVLCVKVYCYIGNDNRDFFIQIRHRQDVNLRLFYDEAWIKDGENHSRRTLLGFMNGLECCLSNTPYQKGIHIATDPAFQQSNQMLDAKLKYMKKHGEKNVKHKPAIEREDLQRLKESAVISPTTSQGLHFNVWFHFILPTWTGRTKKLDEVQFSIPPGWKPQMVRNHGSWRGKKNTLRGDKRHCHKLPVPQTLL